MNDCMGVLPWQQFGRACNGGESRLKKFVHFCDVVTKIWELSSENVQSVTEDFVIVCLGMNYNK